MTKSHKLIGLILITVVLVSGCQKTVAPPDPLLPIPTEKQLHWQKQEMLMFVHFGIKTFYPSENHMGDGSEDPNKFNPEHFDPRQWVEAAKAGGFKGIVLTSKHHDGFCNWQTATTDHSLKSSVWRGGKGDVVKEVADACHEAGLLFGIYSSIYDRNYENSDRNKAYYSDFYIAQLTELLTKYGKVDELWFDGFGAENMKVDFKKVSEVIKEHQPGALIYDSGTLVEYLPDDCASWPGAHGGVKDPNWSFEDENGPWYPAEASLIAQGNWFYNNTPMISLDKFKNYYQSTVGLNAVALINVAPNQNGLIDTVSITRLREFKAWVDGLYINDLTQGEDVKVTTDSWRGEADMFRPEKMVDGNYDTYFTTNDGITTASIEIDLGQPMDIKGVILQEYIPLGQRVSAFTVECFDGHKWVLMSSQRTIGYKKIILSNSPETNGKEFPKTERIRLVIRDSRACPVINTFSVIGTADKEM
ncbi:MAG: alpha-L-fucosidase [Marinilabiliaceae bacterium]|nr:alpha-L-fucosidase [Marinilabiliaceae bacterium]